MKIKFLLILIVLGVGYNSIAQTITWNGSQSTDWNTSTNWTPQTIPGSGNAVVIGNTGNKPILSSSTSIGSLTLNSGAELTLNATLTVSGNVSLTSSTLSGNNLLSAATIGNDSLTSRVITINNSTVNTPLNIAGTSIELTNSVFNEKVNFRRYNSTSSFAGTSTNGGNTFAQKFSWRDKAATQTRFGAASGDVFDDTVIVHKSRAAFIFASSSTTTIFNGPLNLQLSYFSTGTPSIQFGESNGSTALINSNIQSTITNSGLNIPIPILFGTSNSGTIQMAAGKSMSISNNSWGEIRFQKFEKLGTDTFKLNNTAVTAVFSNKSTFNGVVDLNLCYAYLNGGNFKKDVYIKTNFSGRPGAVAVSTGNNRFYENLSIRRVSGGATTYASAQPDTVDGNLTYLGGNTTAFLNSAGNWIKGNLHVDQVGYSFAVNTSASLRIDGNISATNQAFNWSNLGLFFGSNNGYTEFNGTQITLNNGNATSAALTFRNFRKTNPSFIQLNNTSGASIIPIRIENCPEWNGNLTLNGVAFNLIVSTFKGIVKLNRNVNFNNNNLVNQGGNTFEKKLELNYTATGVNSSWTWGASLSDTYLDTVVIYKNHTHPFHFVTNGQAILHGDLIKNDPANSKINLANGTGKLVFSSDKVQNITAVNNKSIPITNIEINKPSNFIAANDTIQITGNLALTNGVFKAHNSTKPIELRQNSSISGGDNFSYIDGYVLNRQNSIKYFPVGHNNRFMPVYSDSVNAALQLKVRYRNENSHLVNSHTNRGSFTDSISTKEYWEVLQNNNPNNSINLNLAFDTLGLCNLQSPTVINFAQTQSGTWIKVNKSNVSSFNNFRILVKGTFNNVASSLVSFVKPDAWCNDSAAYSSTISLNDLEDVALFSANILNANTDVSVDGNVGVNNQYTANYYPISGTFDFNNSTTTALSNQLSNLVNTIEALPKFSLYNLNGQLLQGRNYVLNGNQTLNDSLKFDGDSLQYAIVKINGKLTINSTAQIQSNELKIRNIFFLADTIILNSDAKINGIFISKYYTEIHPLDESQFAAYSLNRVNIVGFTGNNRINLTKPTRMKNINRTRNHFVYEPCSDCNLICDGDFESAVVTDEGRVEKLTTYSPCWIAFGGDNTPDYFNIDLTEGDCTLGLSYAGSETIVGIPDNFNGQDVNHNSVRAGDAYAALLGGAENMSSEIASQHIIPYKKHILEFLTRRPACSNTNTKNFDVMVSLVGTNYSVNVNSEGDLKPNNANTWNRTIRCLDFANGNVPTDIRVLANIGQRVYVDDFFLTQLADAGCNDSICKGDSILIGKPCAIPGAIYAWSSLSANSNSILSYPCGTPNCPQAWVKPNVTENFKLTVTGPASQTSYLFEDGGYYDYTDDIKCTDSDTVEIFVHPLPEFTLEGPQFDCDTAVYTANSAALHVVYTWETPLGQSYVILNNHQIQINWTAIEDSVFVIAHALDTITGCNYSDTLVIYPCCVGTSGFGFTAIKTSDFLLNVNTDNPSVRPEFANWIAINPINGEFSSDLENIQVVFNTTLVGSVAFNEALIVDVGELAVEASELLFNFQGVISCLPSYFTNHINIRKNSFLHACNDKLWKGIYVAGNTAMQDRVTVLESRIEDAYTAVSSSRCARVNITQSVFNRNRVHVYLENCANLSTSTISNNQFLSNDPTNPVFGAAPALINRYTNFTGSPGPRHSYITSQAIRLLNVSRVSIVRNRFENAYNAVYSNGSNFVFNFNRVNRIFQQFNPNDEIDPAILLFTYPTSNPGLFTSNAPIDNNTRGNAVHVHHAMMQNSIQGGYQTFITDTFTFFKKGIFVDNDFNLMKKNINFPLTDRSTITVRTSVFDNNYYENSLLDIGVEIWHVKSRRFKLFSLPEFIDNISITSNRFSNLTNGIKINKTNTQISISTNNLNSNLGLTKRMLKGIEVKSNGHTIPSTQVVPSFPFFINQIYTLNPALTINTNNIGFAQTGNSNNEVKNAIAIVRSFYNWVTLNNIYSNSGQALWGLETNGILIDNSNHSVVSQNLIQRRIGAPVLPQNWAVTTGIELRKSRFAVITRNDMINYSTGLLLRDDNGANLFNTKANITCNVFHGDFYGIYINNSVFGDQFRPSGNLKLPQDNSWSNEPTGGRRIFGNLGLVNQGQIPHDFYARSFNNLYSTSATPPYAPQGLLPTNYDLTLGINQNSAATNPWNVQVSPFPPTSLPPFQTVVSNLGSYCSTFVQSIAETLSKDSLITAELRDSIFGITAYSINPSNINPDTSLYEYNAALDLAKNLYDYPLWLTTGHASDSTYADFYNGMKNQPAFKLWQLSNEAQFNPLDSIMYQDAYRNYGNDSLAMEALQQYREHYRDSLYLAISAISPTFTLESDLRMLHLLQNSNTVLSSNDSLLLQDFAFNSSAPFDERRAIAEVLLDSIYRDGEMEARFSQQTVEDVHSAINPKVFPNPSSLEFTLWLPFDKATVEVFDINGRNVLYTQQIEPTSSYPTKEWSEGFYMIRITEMTGKTYHLKWVKQ